jgi:GMP synthase (glutamine-hydrolysing)
MPGLKVRVSVYRDAGYFPPEDGEMILEQASRADLSKAPNVLENFVRRYKQAI